MVIVFLIVLVVIVECIIYFNKKNLAQVSEHGDQDDIDDDDSTILIQKEEDEETCMAKIGQLKAEDGSAVFEFNCIAKTTIGRKSTCNIQIQGDKSVSGVHCIISCDSNYELVVRDNNSSNGTYLNGEKIGDERKLKSGDVLEIGRRRYIVQM